jgi:NAD(P)H-flavin reductase
VEIASTNPWLSVSPVSEYPADLPWAADYPDVQPPRGLHVRQSGRLPEVVSRYGGWGDRQILICGRPEMVRATRAALLAKRPRRAHPARPALGLMTRSVTCVTFVPSGPSCETTITFDRQ